MPQRELLDAFDAQTIVAVMLETPDAVARADEIAAVPGVDMVMLGPHDLTAEMGILGDFRDPAFLDAARGVAQACRDHDVIFGIAGIRDQELLDRAGRARAAVRRARGPTSGSWPRPRARRCDDSAEIPVGKEADA